MNPTRQYSFKRKTMRWFFLTALIFCYSFIYGQDSWDILDLNHELFPEKKALTVTTLARIGDYGFHTNVGGISFLAVASPDKNLKNENISLDFLNNRLVVEVGKKAFYSDLPFWQLAPIVGFVNSPYNVAFTQLSDTVGGQGAQFRYHPVFLDNLLGLRLFQSDFLDAPDILWDLPVDAQHRYILAPSEQTFVPQRDTTLQQTIYNKLLNAGFTSFVLTDENAKIVFGVDDYGLVFSGKPYFCFTKTRTDTSNFQSLRTQLFECYSDIETHAKLLLKGEYSSALNPRTNLSALLAALNNHKEGRIFNPYSMYFIEKALSKLDSLNNLTDAEIGIQFQVLDEYTESFKPYWEVLKKYNPAVYSAVENVSRWSAFFRYVRKINPDNWAAFVKKVESKGEWDAPAVKTPTSFEVNYIRYFQKKEKNK